MVIPLQAIVEYVAVVIRPRDLGGLPLLPLGHARVEAEALLVHGVPEIISEDFEHGRHYGGVRAVNPFVEAGVRELPPLYHAKARRNRPARRSR